MGRAYPAGAGRTNLPAACAIHIPSRCTVDFPRTSVLTTRPRTARPDIRAVPMTVTEILRRRTRYAIRGPGRSGPDQPERPPRSRSRFGRQAEPLGRKTCQALSNHLQRQPPRRMALGKKQGKRAIDSPRYHSQIRKKLSLIFIEDAERANGPTLPSSSLAPGRCSHRASTSNRGRSGGAHLATAPRRSRSSSVSTR